MTGIPLLLNIIKVLVENIELFIYHYNLKIDLCKN